MFNFDVPRYEKVVDGAIANRGAIEQCVDQICREGYKNIFLVGVGGTYAHYLPLKYLAEINSNIDIHVEIAAEFMAMKNKHFGKGSVVVFCSRTGNTKEIVACAEYCKRVGARTVAYIAHEGTPLASLCDHVFLNHADDDHLGESIYLHIIPLILRFLKNNGDFNRYDELFAGVDKLTPYLIKAKEAYEEYAAQFAKKHEATAYHMVIGSGALWGEAYDYAMCILEEMQWIKTKSIHAAEFFHGTLELVEENTSLILLFGEDETRPLMERVQSFAAKVTKEIAIFDTKKVELPIAEDLRKYVSPLVIYCILEDLSRHLEHVRNHPLTTRRYYRQIEY